MEEAIVEKDEGKFSQGNDRAIEKFVCPKDLKAWISAYVMIYLEMGGATHFHNLFEVDCRIPDMLANPLVASYNYQSIQKLFLNRILLQTQYSKDSSSPSNYLMRSFSFHTAAQREEVHTKAANKK